MKNFLRSTIFMGKNFLRLTLIAFALFAISLSAYSQYPTGWEINPSDYEFDGEITAKVLINDDRQESGVLAAFVGGECRGISEGSSSVWGYVYTLRVYSDQASGETISFKFFDPNSEEIHDVNETTSFISDMVLGSVNNPETLTISVLSTNTRLSELAVDDNMIEGFDPLSLNYEYFLPYGATTIPVVSATAEDQNATIEITQATQIPGEAYVIVTAENDNYQETYSIGFMFEPNKNPDITEIGDQQTQEDTPLQLTASFTDDPNETEFDITVETNNENVRVEFPELKDGSFTYTLIPEDDWYGTAEITVTIYDEREGSDREVYQLTVTPVNDEPVLDLIGPQQTNEETTKTLEILFLDADSEDTHTIVVESDNSSVIVQNLSGHTSGSTVDLVPADAFSGTANITVTVTDDSGEPNDSDSETFVLSVTNDNDAPVITPVGDQEIVEDTYIDLAVTFTDDDPNDTHVIIVNSMDENVNVENLSGNTNGSTYRLTPAANWHGEAQISVNVSDLIGAFDEEIFMLTVTNVNDAPVITNVPGQTIGEGEDFQGFDLNLFVSDVDNDLGELEWEFSGNTDLIVAQQGSYIEIEIPDKNWNGTETITFTAIDPEGLRATNAATFTVTPFNDPPEIEAIPGQELPEGATFDPISLDSFVEDEETPVEEIQWTFVGNVELNVSIVDRIVTITAPNEDWFGSEEILFTAIDGGGKTAQAGATFTLTPVNDIPVLTPPEVQTILEGGAFQQLDLNAVVEDVETPDNEIEWVVMTQSEVLSVEIIDGIALITIRDEDWNGTENIQLKAIDGDGAEVTFIAGFQVTPINDPPVMEDIPDQLIPEGGEFDDINLNQYIFDEETEPANMVWIATPGTNISISIVANVASIEILDEEWNGTETIFFMATDEDGAMAMDRVRFTVTPVNDHPVLTQIPPQETTEGSNFETIILTEYVEDVETPDHRIAWSVDGRSADNLKGLRQNLIVNINNNITANVIVKDKDWYGEEIIRFFATDEDGATEYMDVVFTVTAENDVPVVEPIPNQTIVEGGSFEPVPLDEFVFDVETEDSNVVWSFSGNDNINVQIGAPALKIDIIHQFAFFDIPNENWFGTETITFTAEDEGGLIASVQVEFTVLPENDTPTAEDMDGFTVSEGGNFQTIDLKPYFDDVETEDVNFIWEVSYTQTTKVDRTGLDVTVNADGIVTVDIPDENWHGFEEYEFTAIDEGGLSASSIAYFEVLPVNDSPEVKAPMGTKNVAEDFGEMLIDLREVFFDIDEDDLQFELVGMNPAEIVSAEIFESNFLKINSIEGASGQVTITVRANDETDRKDSVEDILTLNISSTNDAPVVSAAMGTLDDDEDFTDITINLNDVFTDSDGEDLVYDITEVIGTSITAAVSGNSLIISSILNEASDGNTVEVSATDGYGETVSDIATINVAPINDAPVIEGQEPITTPEDTPYELDAEALEVFDPDNEYPTDFTILITGGSNYTVSDQSIVPNENYHGTLSVPVMVNDGELTSNLFRLIIEVESVNDQPQIVPIGDQLMDEDGRMKLNIEFADNDILDTHTLEINSNMEEVHIEYDAAINQEDGGSFEIVPFQNWSGTAIITVEIMDSSGDDATNIGTEEFVLTVKNVNDKPVIVTQSLPGATQEELYSAIIDISDIDSPELDVTLVSAPAWLTISDPPPASKELIQLSEGQGSFALTGVPGPNARNFLLVVKVMDEESSTTASYELEVTLINYPPEVEDDAYNVREDNAKKILLYGSDNETPDSDLIFAITTDPTNGTLALSGRTNNVFVYTPNENYFGADFFEYSVTDGDGQSSTARIDLNVEFVNDKPLITADEDSYSTLQETPITLAFSADDSKDGANAALIDYEVVLSPANGTFEETATAGEFTYTPNNGFFGFDNVMLIANETDQDPNLSSAFITRRIQVVRQNEAPIAYEKTVRLKEDESATFNFLASDDKTDILSLVYEVVSAPSHATTLAISGNQFTYLAEENYNGSDRFTFRVQDEDGAWSEEATVDILIASVNDVPIGRNETFDANGATSLDIDFAELITDPDTPFDQLELEFTLESGYGTAGALGGTMTHKSGSIYTFEQGATGLPDDVVLWRVKEGDHISPFYTAEINGMETTSTIKVGIPNIIAVSAEYNTDYGSPILVEFVSIDLAAPVEQLTNVVTVDPTQGSLSNFQLSDFSASTTRYSATYTPTNNADIQDVITFTATDGADTEIATITINISSVDVAPDLTDISNVQMTEDTPVNIEIPFVDPDTDVANLTWTFTSTPAVTGLEFTVTDASTGPATIGVTLPQDYTGSSTIEVKLEDNTALFDEIDFTLTIDNVNDAPELDNVPGLNASEDTPFVYTFTADDVDTDNANLTYSATCSPAGAATSIIFSGNQMTFTPAPNYNGDVDVTVTVEDNETPSASDELTFTLSIANENDAPELSAIVDPSAIDEDSGIIQLNITPTDIDASDDLTVTLSSSNTALFPAGSMTVDQPTANTGTMRTLGLTHAENVFGTSVITVTVSDGTASTIQQFNVTVNEVNDKPVLDAIEPITIEENTSTTVPVVASDVDSPSLNYGVSSNNTDLIAMLINNGGSYELSVEAQNNYIGLSQVTITIDDNDGGITTQTIDVDVTNVDQIPYLANPTADVTATEDDPDIIIPLADIFDDPDNDNALIEFSIDSNTDETLVTTSINGTNLTLDLLDNAFGDADITIKGVSNGKTVYDVFNIDVAAVDDVPEVLNTIADIDVKMNEPDHTIDLSDIFTDVDNDDALIAKAVSNNTNTSLIAAGINGNTLTVEFTPDMHGGADITIEGTSNGKSVTTTFNIIVRDNTAIGEPDEEVDDALIIYPIPNNGEFSFNYTSELNEEYIVRIFDLTGKLVYDKVFDENDGLSVPINIRNYGKGIYIFQLITDSKKSFTQKIIVY